ncbi:MAG: hypothetical protein JWR01_11, partial [Subtercola sp.]|nr:hypothetical protein [Subtercola sp.]
GGRSFVDDVGEMVDGELAVPEGEDDAYSGGVGEHAEDFDGQFNVGTFRVSPAKLVICIHTQIMSRVGADGVRGCRMLYLT